MKSIHTAYPFQEAKYVGWKELSCQETCKVAPHRYNLQTSSGAIAVQLGCSQNNVKLIKDGWVKVVQTQRGIAELERPEFKSQNCHF